MRKLVAVGIVLAAVAFPACAQHGGGFSGGFSGGGAHGVGGGGHAAGMARMAPGGGFQRGVRQRYGGAPRVQGYGGTGRGYGAQRFDGIGGVANRPMFAGRGLRDGDRDGDDRGRGFGRGYGAGGRFGEGWRDRGIPYVNPYGYGYGYPLLYSGLTYGGDLGYGNDGGYDAGANGDDADNAGDGSGDGSDGQGYDGQPPVPYYDGGSADEGPAGYVGPAGSQGDGGYAAYSGGSGYAGSGGRGQPSEYPSGTAAGVDSSGQMIRLAANRTTEALAAPDAVTLVFKDGRPPEKIHNYALTRTTLYVTDAKSQEIPVADLDLAATVKVNREAGVKFQLPQ